MACLQSRSFTESRKHLENLKIERKYHKEDPGLLSSSIPLSDKSRTIFLSWRPPETGFLQFQDVYRQMSHSGKYGHFSSFFNVLM